MTEPTPTPQRRKAMTEAGRQMLQRQRARLNREQAALGEKLVNEARHATSMGKALAQANDPVHNAISRGIVRRVAGVLASEKVTPAIEVRPVNIEGGEVMQAYTDFSSIVVNYTPHTDKRLLAATMRGLMYHEGGHIRWTTPFQTLVQQIVDVALGGSIYAAPGEHSSTAYQWAWNALEDQRMETAVVSDSPRKAAYFTPMIMTELVESPDKAAANFPLLIWRRYLPKHIRRGARKGFVEMHGDNGEALARAFEAVTTQYVTATDFATMWDAVCQAVVLYAQHRTAASLDNQAMGHANQRNSSEAQRGARNGEKLEIPIDPSMADEDDDDDADDGEGQAAEAGDEGDAEGDAEAAGEGQDAAEGGEAGDGADDGEGASDDAGESTDGEADVEGGEGAGGEAGDHSHEGDDETLTQDDIDAVTEEANDKWLNDAAVEEDLKAYEDALNGGASQLPVYIGGVSKDVAAAAKAENLADQIQQAFEMATMDRQPAWVEQQRRGIINVPRYVTAQAGDVEYFRNWVEDDQPGYNMAVSVLLDYSGSMYGDTVELAQCGYAAKLACWNLGIPCTVTLWDNKATTLFDANEMPRGLPIINTSGSTNPSMALADLENQRYDKETHLVLMMTDGAWDDDWNDRHHRHGGKAKRTVAFYAGHGRHFIGFGYSSSGYSSNAYAAKLKGYGIRESYGISDLMAIPKRLQEALIRLA